MDKKLFKRGLMQARKFCLWIDKLDSEGIDLGNEYLDTASEALYFLLVNGDADWDYDDREEHSWVVQFTSDPDFNKKYRRYERDNLIWNLTDPGTLYDFICHMNKVGWDKP